MPNKDGTGPEGKGTLTGRRLGECKTQESSSEDKPQRRGLGNRRGLGKGKGRRQRENRDL
jgi:hypothetical protein